MKKSIVVILIVLSVIIGFLIGSNSVIKAQKWVEEEGGLYIICTDFFGNVYEDVATKNSHCYDYFAFDLARR